MKKKELAFLGSCKPKIRKLILQNADKEVNAIQECLINFLKGNFQIPQPN